MRFTKVDEVPKRGAYHDLKDDLDRFMKSGLKIAKIDFHQDEYKSATIAANCLRVAVKRHGLNGIKVILRGGNVYLENNM